jgi:glycolate oxidase FAD binding subunit
LSLVTTEDFTPTTAPELARFVAENARQQRRALYPAGGRTALGFGGAAVQPGVTIATGELRRVVDYPARDMTVTVEAGIRSEDLQKLLAAERQRLPIDVAQAHRATLGGAIATNTSGPGRFGHGTFRDYVIGISAVDGQGRLFSAGGRVVKNVAGYDICKLLVGSLGTLAIITQVTLKLRPQPQTRRLLWMTFDALRNLDDALSRLLTSQTRPVAIEALNNKAGRQIRTEAKLALPAERPVLCLAFEGAERETAWQVETVEAELRSLQPREVARVGGDDVETLWSALTEYQAASDDPLTFQATLPPSKTVEFIDAATHAGVAVQAHAGNGIVIGHLPDRCASAEAALELLRPLRAGAERAGGALVVLNCDSDWKPHIPAFGRGDLPWPLMRRAKAALDPHGVLSPGRFGAPMETAAPRPGVDASAS